MMPIGMLVGVVRCYWERCVEKSTMLDHSMCLDVTMLALQKLFHCNHWQVFYEVPKRKTKYIPHTLSPQHRWLTFNNSLVLIVPFSFLSGLPCRFCFAPQVRVGFLFLVGCSIDVVFTSWHRLDLESNGWGRNNGRCTISSTQRSQRWVSLRPTQCANNNITCGLCWEFNLWFSSLLL